MGFVELMQELLLVEDVQDWSFKVFAAAQELGFEQALYAILPNKYVPLEQAFLKSNYSDTWRTKYDQNRFGYIDPTVTHCLSSSVPLVWTDEIFKGDQAKEFYEEACSYGVRSGIIYPIHGPSGEFGLMSVVSDSLTNASFRKDLVHTMPHLSMLKDYAFQSSRKFVDAKITQEKIALTVKELEVMKWTAAGKTSWEVSKILTCSENTINFHLKRIRGKLGVTSKNQAVARSISLGLFVPG